MSNSKNESDATEQPQVDPHGEAMADPADEASTDDLATLTAERDQLAAQLQRTLADLQNFRKRRAQEMAEARKSAIETLTSEMLPVLDNFHLATEIGQQTGDAAVQSIRDGLLMVQGLLQGVFERHGVREISAEGELFDPTVHEAVGIDPDPQAPSGKVTAVLQKGYTLEGRVIRPTRVMVGGGSATAEREAGESEAERD
ncbi:MAG: nucleotide exchange factor GrpE [Planctomycetes bacterium]|nr:nucleotide exchange factor GrpE [Planctomycetota bacterium]MCB9888553.1 nucleotide exchange factor GrpE [Planctomycetota bacterium]